MEMYIENLPSYRIAYVRQVGPYGPANALAMNTLKQWADKKQLLHETAILFGIPQDDPASTPPQNCRYDASIVVTESERLEDELVEIGELLGGDYLICKVRHTAEAIQQAWNVIIPHLQTSGYRMDNKPVIERYRWELLNQHYCEICVPVRPV
ncbi:MULTISPECIES: GyrI-like domain-containing protein [unclassified Paenibacillus]|uniref:AraC family transcriptional regulator n=1 Tax=unclassified Paenibacillus TaxID=185978 RepID=UPI000CFE0EAA|nr:MULTISPECIES: GyrI-like domain-containing protein [unclassified Paenibacillus]PRA07160.1 DNA gyrase inhibitor [Paenibacillus sp. MYb63]PRA50806.1 DNA gyrase inhibitor [Paenibacillus sp. MYb67]QZN73942.1 GyrI-like domain-containing protein [Paenibacillus sp. DR312]